MSVWVLQFVWWRLFRFVCSKKENCGVRVSQCIMAVACRLVYANSPLFLYWLLACRMAATQAQQNFVEQQSFEQGEIQVQNSSRNLTNVSQTTEFSQAAAMQHAGIATTLAQSSAPKQQQQQHATIQQQAGLQSQPQQIQQQQQTLQQQQATTTIITPNVISPEEFQSNAVPTHKEGTKKTIIVFSLFRFAHVWSLSLTCYV